MQTDFPFEGRTSPWLRAPALRALALRQMEWRTQQSQPHPKGGLNPVSPSRQEKAPSFAWKVETSRRLCRFKAINHSKACSEIRPKSRKGGTNEHALINSGSAHGANSQYCVGSMCGLELRDEKDAAPSKWRFFETLEASS